MIIIIVQYRLHRRWLELVLGDDGGVWLAAEERAGTDFNYEILEAAAILQIGSGNVVGDDPLLKGKRMAEGVGEELFCQGSRELLRAVE